VNFPYLRFQGSLLSQLRLQNCSEFCKFLEGVLFMKLPDELFDLGDAALENEITAIGSRSVISPAMGVSSNCFTLSR
jgi:hypothetical protein